MEEIKIGSALLIDDSEIDQKSYERILRRSGVVGEIISYTYADDALRYLTENKDNRIDVIFLDINMPRMDGFEFLEAATERLGNKFAKMVVVMLTTSLDPRDRARAESNPLVRQLLNKPLAVEDVLKVAHLLDDCSG